VAHERIRTGYVIASNRVAVERQPVLYMYREPPGSDDDSGWRFFAGTEDQAYADDPHNFALYNCSTIVDIDPSIRPYLDHPSGCAFERSCSSESFRQVPFEQSDEA
jgi:hypothetical protein